MHGNGNPVAFTRALPKNPRSHFPTTMTANIDMSLEDIIKRSAADADGARRRARGRGHGHGPDRRFAIHNPHRTTPYSVPLPQPRQVSQYLIPEMVLGGGSGVASETGTKLYISNLDYGVSNEDIKLLFSEEGELKRYCIHYDKSGRSKGTAEVVYMRQSDALAAIKKYDNMKLDGKPLKIELVGVNLVSPAVMPLYQNSLLGGPNVVLESGRGKGNGVTRGRSPRFHGKERGHVGKVSAKDLDDDLERYRLEAMQINKENEN